MEDFDAEFAAFEAELNTVDTKKATEQAQEALAAPNPSTTKSDSKEEDDPPPEKKRRKMDDSKPKIATVQVAAAAAPTINKNYLKSVVNMYETMHENIEKSVDVADKTQSSSSDYSMFPPTMSHTEAKDFMAQVSDDIGSSWEPDIRTPFSKAFMITKGHGITRGERMPMEMK
mmetsp:Transcript_1161/g.1675  ORF Transcript_1161/g.1675 Transcript_1161/m.1675 type:complete len:173 (-) Transcript_1161:476-994(-)